MRSSDPSIRRQSSLSVVNRIVQNAASKSILTAACSSTKMDNRMTREERLIKAVSKKQILYDNECKYYYDFPMKEEAWEQISRELGEPADVLKKKWMSLRDCFRKALIKRHSQVGKKMRPWRYEKQMAFVKPFFSMLPDDLQDNSKHDSAEETQEELQDNEEDDLIAEHSNPKLESPSPSPISWQSFDVSEKNNTVTKRRKISGKISTRAAHVMQKYEEDLVVSDHVSSFFKAMEDTVRTLSPLLQIEVKSKISAVISEFELKNLKDRGNSSQQGQNSGSGSNIQQKPPKSEIVWCDDEEISR